MNNNTTLPMGTPEGWGIWLLPSYTREVELAQQVWKYLLNGFQTAECH